MLAVNRPGFLIQPLAPHATAVLGTLKYDTFELPPIEPPATLFRAAIVTTDEIL